MIIKTTIIDVCSYLITMVLFFIVVGFLSFNRGYDVGIKKPSEFLEANCSLGYNTIIHTEEMRVFCMPLEDK